MANYLFLYLDSGGGHLSPAKNLKERLEAYSQEKGLSTTVHILNGFSPKQIFSRGFYEDAYHFASTKMPALYTAFFDITKVPLALHFCQEMCAFGAVSFLQDYIQKHEITHVVSFHFALTTPVYRAIKKLKKNIPLDVVITDPYTAHPAWFLIKDVRFFCFSQELKQKSLAQFSWLKEEQIHVVPFLVSSGFYPLSIEEKRQEKQKHNLSEDDKIIAIQGGGEGLHNVRKIVKNFIEHYDKQNPFTLLVFCGKNTEDFEYLQRLKEKKDAQFVQVFPFVKNLYEYIRIADVIISKAGASSVMENTHCAIPAIYSFYIHGQELGNIQFVRKERIGFFIPDAKEIVIQAKKILSDTHLQQKIKDNCLSLSLSKDVSSFLTLLTQVD